MEMQMIFLDDKIKRLRPIAEKARKKFPEACIVLFGMDKKNAHSQYGHERIGIINYSVVHIPGAPEDGIAIQEHLNRYFEHVTHICIVTERDTIRPLTEYIVRPGFRIVHRIDRMLKQPYENKMKDMVSAGNMRKHF